MHREPASEGAPPGTSEGGGAGSPQACGHGELPPAAGGAQQGAPSGTPADPLVGGEESGYQQLYLGPELKALLRFAASDEGSLRRMSLIARRAIAKELSANYPVLVGTIERQRGAK